jgi:tetratricopeptide (TPR) repeat protein
VRLTANNKTAGPTVDAPASSQVSPPRRAVRRLPAPLLGLVALVVGVAGARFVSFDGDASPAPPVASANAARTLSDRVTTLEQSVAADPDNIGARQALGVAYVRRAAENGDPAFYGLAERSFDEADALVPSDPMTLLGRGALALSLHDFARAKELGLQVTDALPSSPDALGLLVDAQVELGDYDGAAITLQRMLDVRPGLPALSRASYLRELHGDLPGAVDAMRRAEVAGTGAPFDRATVTVLLGDLYYESGQLDEALSAYNSSLDSSPGLVAGEVGTARVLAAKGEVAAAIEVLTPVVDRQPVPGALVLLGELQESAGQTTQAVATHELVRAVASLQEQAGQVVDLEMALFEADLGTDTGRAVALARQAYEARPDNVFAADALAWALFRHGDAAGAVPFSEQAVRLGTADSMLHYHAAEVFAAVGDVERAATSLRVTADLNPNSSLRHAGAVRTLAGRLGVSLPATGPQ